ncbi:MAG: MerR family transcriptional regulator [Eubacteriales bacterium]|nr:MerR family transcriptional regulator [Eubacteriales bacterium]
MYKIGEFSVLSKTTIKTLRFYDKIGLFFPSKVDSNGYRYYETSKLLELSKIIALRQICFTIEGIKQVLKGANFNQQLSNKLKEIENLQKENIFKISRIKYLLGDKSIKYKVVENNFTRIYRFLQRRYFEIF